MYFHTKQVPFNTFTWQIVTTKSQGLSEGSEENPDALIPLIKHDPDQIPLSLWGPVSHIKNEFGEVAFLVIQWLGLSASTAGRWIQSLVGDLRSQKPQGVPPPKKNKDEWVVADHLKETLKCDT